MDDLLPAGLHTLERAAIFIAAISAGLAGLALLVQRFRRWTKRTWALALELRRRAKALEDLLNHELNPNSGTSIKDAVHRLEDKVAGNSERLTSLEEHLDTLAEAQRHVWPAIEAVARAAPPNE